MSRDWFWQLRDAKQGPDWFFFASFAQEEAERLALLVRQHPLPGFSYYRAAELYVDQRNYDALVANIEGGQQRNIWIYHTIEIRGCDLVIERGYGGYPDAHGATETSLLVMLAQASDLTWQRWKARYGGQGYSTEQIASGSTAAELLEYLRD